MQTHVDGVANFVYRKTCHEPTNEGGRVERASW